MPRGDGSGPWGSGPMTGRGLGYCAGYGEPGFTAGAGGYGAGRGAYGGGRGVRGGRGAWGGGRGYRNRFYATGLTGWERAARGDWAWGAPQYRGQMAGAPGAEATTADLQARADMLERELTAVREALAGMEKGAEAGPPEDA